jgi:hypothetical protein
MTWRNPWLPSPMARERVFAFPNYGDRQVRHSLEA